MVRGKVVKSVSIAMIRLKMKLGSMLPVLCLILAVGFSSAENQTETTFKWLMKMHDPHRYGNFSKMSINESCQMDMDAFVDALMKEELWAVQMFDSNGRYSSQFFFGNDYWLGSQTLCTELSRSKVAPFPLNFHVARIKVRLSANLTPRDRLVFLGICFPSSCMTEDVTKILTYQLKNDTSDQKVHMTIIRVRPVPGSYKILEDRKFLTLGGSVLVIAFFMVIGTLTELIISHKNGGKEGKNNAGEMTEKNEENKCDIENNNRKKNFYDIKVAVIEKEILEKQKKGKLRAIKDIRDDDEKPKRRSRSTFCEFLLAFSVLSNGSKILTCRNTAEDSLNSVHGLRFLSLAWVVLVHTYLQIFAIGENKGLRAVTEKNFGYQIVGNATYSVDSFFIISGLLVSYLFFKSNRNEKEVRGFLKMIGKFVTIILYRFMRLTPVYIVVLGMVHLTMVFLKDSSVFETPLIVQLNCDTFWWRNILYINNFFPKTEMCMLWSWYMAVDTQFFVLSAIFLLIAKKHFRFSVFIMFSLMISSWCTTAYIAYVNKLQVKVQEPLILFDELYDKPWTRIGPYIVGMCAGWFLSEKNCKITIPAPVVLLGWLLSLGGLLGIVFCIRNGLGVAESSVYAALGHTAWGLCLAWIVVACRCGYGGWINSLLSWSAFFPFSRLTYCAYLVHPVIMFLTNYVMDGPFHMHNGVVVIIFLGNLISSYLLSFILSLAFEAPFVRILKLMLSQEQKR